MPQRNLLILLAVTALSYACYVRGEQNPYARYASGGLETIDESALQHVPESELFSGAMQGMVEVLRRHGDEHSQFLSEAEADPLRSDIRQEFGGIGVRIRLVGNPPRLVIAAPPDPGSPAAHANLLPGDQILAIEGRSTEGMTMSAVLQAMRGEPGTVLELTVRHENGGESRTQKLTRAK
jgi:carboxyl-terminal processing protease